jgi:inhibitor of cysteine peptidase
MKTKVIISFTFIFVLLLLALWLIPQNGEILSNQENKDDPYLSVYDGEIKVLKSLADEREFLANLNINSDSYSRKMALGIDQMNTSDMVAVPESASMTKDEVDLDFSDTNIQVLGVDEADIVKTDGQYIYALVYNDLYIIKAYPPEEIEVLSKISFTSRPSDIFLEGDKLAVIGQDYEIVKDAILRSFPRSSNYSYFKIFDISDREDPVKVRDLSFEGNYFNSRMINGYVYLILNDYRQPQLIDESLAPKIIDNGQVLTKRPDIYYFNIPYSSLTINSINVINLNNINEEIASHSFLLDGASTLYASPEAIYLGLTKYLNQWEVDWQIMYDTIFTYLNEELKKKIKVIEETENFVLNDSEKKHKIEEIFHSFLGDLDLETQREIESKLEIAKDIKYEELKDKWETTVIHKIRIDKEKIDHVAQGEIPGRTLNQFSFDEHNNYLRVATSKSARMNESSSSGVYILNSDLDLISQVDNLAPGERIYSVRFMGDRAYLVTFFQVDPLFALDLSDPYNPAALGELKIPGFSNYLHPYDRDHLIGFGKDADLNGQILGLKLSLFNVADIENPIELDSYIFGGPSSDSVALHDHRAFLFNKEKNLLVLPATLRSSFSRSLDFSGAIVFKIENNEFIERARIDHLDGDISQRQDDWRGFSYNDSSVKRSLYIDNYLYTLSNRLIRVHNLDNLNWLSGLRFSSQELIEIRPYDKIQ